MDSSTSMSRYIRTYVIILHVTFVQYNAHLTFSNLLCYVHLCTNSKALINTPLLTTPVFTMFQLLQYLILLICQYYIFTYNNLHNDVYYIQCVIYNNFWFAMIWLCNWIAHHLDGSTVHKL